MIAERYIVLTTFKLFHFLYFLRYRDQFMFSYIIQTQQLFSNCMKVTKRPQKTVQIVQKQSSDGDCECQLLDTSFSDIGDSDCSCSQCLEANLQAFNQLKQQEKYREKEAEVIIHRGGSTRTASNKHTRGISRNTANQNKSTAKISGFRSVDKMRKTRPKTSIRRQQNYQSEIHQNGQSTSPKFSREEINDYIKITQYRARSYLQQRNGLKKNEEEKRNELKTLIKQNLQALKYTARNIFSGISKNSETRSYKWNHQPYHCKSRIQCRKIHHYQPNLQDKRQEIQKIQKRIQQYKEKNKEKTYQCPDKCPRHHMRTSKKQLIEIQKLIKKKAKQYQLSRIKSKTQKQQKQKIKEAKLRAIDLKCKQKVAKSKKYDPTDQRTSFHNSIDHFSTFSQLRINNQQRKQERLQRKKVKAAIKDGKQLEQAIYEDLDGELVADHPPIHSKINVDSRYVQGQPEEQWCEKIVKDARIKPPKDLKKDDKQIKKAKERKRNQAKQAQTKESKANLSARDLKKEQQRRKQIEAQIQRKKQEILNHFQKRNTNPNKYDPKNKQLREDYEQQLKKQSQQRNKQTPKLIDYAYDLYRQTYKNQPGKEVSHMRIIGDPLVQEYQYQKNTKRAKQLQVNPVNKQIFTSSGKQLIQKKKLKV